jgi:hypothetical protein
MFTVEDDVGICTAAAPQLGVTAKGSDRISRLSGLPQHE